MPRRISDYPDAFTGWNFISSIGSIISVAATALFLHIVYLQLVEGKAIFGYPWAVPQLFNDYLRILKDKSSPSLEWALHNPPKPHAFASLPLQSAINRTVLDTIHDAIVGAGLARSAPARLRGVNDNPQTVHDHAVNDLNQIRTWKDAYISRALHQKSATTSKSEKAELDSLATDAIIAYNKAVSRIKESANTAIDLIDDSDATAHLLFKEFLPICNLPILQILATLWRYRADFFIIYLQVKALFDKKVVKYIYKSRFVVLSIFTLIILISFVLVNIGGYFYQSYILCDAPRAWGLYFQDSASPQMEALVELHNNIMYYLVAILFAVGWIQGSIVKNFDHSIAPISNKYVNHGTLIELIWTITPALILVLIAFPSFKLLYLMDEVTDPSLSVVAEGHQWYWSYEYPDFLNSEGDNIEFDSYLVPEPDLEKGGLRMLEVDNRVILPEITHTRFIVTAADVIHSFAIPALGVKCDAYPGRLNQFSVLINRLGAFYGQCSEICGILHSSMPIVVESVSLEKFLYWLQEEQ